MAGTRFYNAPLVADMLTHPDIFKQLTLCSALNVCDEMS